MARIEDYALLGDTHASALVSRAGAVDWMCVPRPDSPAIFAALLGDERNGHWTIAPDGPALAVERRYRGETLTLETTTTTAQGTVRTIDAMPLRGGRPYLVRVVEGVAGTVDVRSVLAPRFDYGAIAPWIAQSGDAVTALAGPEAVALRCSVPHEVSDATIVSHVRLQPGQRATFALVAYPSHERLPAAIDVDQAIAHAEATLRAWMRPCAYDGAYAPLVRRSLLTLKALTYAPTGGIVAAPTTSLPERIGGVRNWDYRFCWLRDAALTLGAFLDHGFVQEARAWRDWLLRAGAGNVAGLQVLYDVYGARRLPELELPWLAGYEGSKPVRVGNAAAEQFQLDIYGELVDALATAAERGLGHADFAWRAVPEIADEVERRWREPDQGIWEIRGPARHFTYSKVMAWVVLDRAIAAAGEFGLDDRVPRWTQTREAIRADVLAHGVDARGVFVQAYGSDALDASALMIPAVGFLPLDDSRITATVDAIARELDENGYVMRYRSDDSRGSNDGLPPGEGAFLPCSFWLVRAEAMLGRVDAARTRFERLIALCNDVGLISEEVDPHSGRLLGNFPQAFTHVALVHAARALDAAESG